MSSTWQTIHRVYNLYMFTISHFVITKCHWQGPRCGMVCEYTVYWSVLSSWYIPWSFPHLPPCSLHTLAPSLHPPYLPTSLPLSLPPSLPSIPSLTPLTPSLPSLSPSLHPSLPLSLAPSLPPPPAAFFPPSSPTLHCSLPPTLCPSSLLAYPLPACLPPAVQLNVHCIV